MGNVSATGGNYEESRVNELNYMTGGGGKFNEVANVPGVSQQMTLDRFSGEKLEISQTSGPNTASFFDGRHTQAADLLSRENVDGAGAESSLMIDIRPNYDIGISVAIPIAGRLQPCTQIAKRCPSNANDPRISDSMGSGTFEVPSK